ADIVRDAVLAAELDHRDSARNAVLRFQRTRLVVKTGMDDTAVVPGLMARDFRLFLHDADPKIRETTSRLERCRKTHNATADDGKIKLEIHIPSKPRSGETRKDIMAFGRCE